MDVNKYTRKRKTAIALAILLWVFSLLMIIIGVPISLSGVFAAIFLPLSLIVTIVSYAYCIKIAKYYKQIIVRDAFKVYNFDYYCRQDGLKQKSIPYNIEEDEFYSLSFFNKTSGNTYYTNDLVVGEYENVSFRSVDVYCYYVVNTGKTTTIVKLFKGRVYAFNLQSDNNFKLVIREESDTLNSISDKSLEEIEFESIDANKKFNFYTNDKHLAFYYIKPNIIENLLKLENYFKGKLFVTIVNGSLYVGKDDDVDSFELKIDTTYEALHEEIEDEIDFIKLTRNSFNFDKAKPKQKELKIK